MNIRIQIITAKSRPCKVCRDEVTDNDNGICDTCINPEANEVSQEDLEAAAEYHDRIGKVSPAIDQKYIDQGFVCEHCHHDVIGAPPKIINDARVCDECHKQEVKRIEQG